MMRTTAPTTRRTGAKRNVHAVERHGDSQSQRAIEGKRDGLGEDFAENDHQHKPCGADNGGGRRSQEKRYNILL
jgi:hypothetical protein